MRDLVDHARGELQIEASPGYGVSVLLRVPLR